MHHETVELDSPPGGIRTISNALTAEISIGFGELVLEEEGLFAAFYKPQASPPFHRQIDEAGDLWKTTGCCANRC